MLIVSNNREQAFATIATINIIVTTITAIIMTLVINIAIIACILYVASEFAFISVIVIIIRSKVNHWHHHQRAHRDLRIKTSLVVRAVTVLPGSNGASIDMFEDWNRQRG